jgi:YD repeat-containing protein
MLNHRIPVIFVIAIICATTSFSQQIETGNFNDWDFSPSKVFGNLRLQKTTERTFIRISRVADSIARVETVNPSGIVTNTSLLIFKNNIISKIEEANQFGEIVDIQQFTPADSNTLLVTQVHKGVNSFLPCKSAKYIYNNGLLREKQYLSFKGLLAEDQNGVAIVRYKRYDDTIRFADTKEISYFDVQGNPVKSKNVDYHKVVYDWDLNDNRVAEFYYGMNGEPTTIRQSQVASVVHTYDADNNQLKYEVHALDGSITKNTFGVSVGENIFEKGYRIVTTRYNQQHKVIRAFAAYDSIAIIKDEYDKFGNEVKEAFFDENGLPIRDYQGAHKYIYKYFPNNTLQKESFFDETDSPVLNRDGFHAIVYEPDTLGRLLSRMGLGIDEDPVFNQTDEVYLIKYRYDDAGRRYSTSYWKDSVTKMPRWNGTYEQITYFNEDGQNAGFQYLNMEGKAFRSKDGSSGNKLIYDSDGRIGERVFIFDDKPVMRVKALTYGYASIQYAYNDRGRVSELTFFDTQHNSVNASISLTNTFPAHRIVYVYQGAGIVKQFFYVIGQSDPVQEIDCLTNDYIDVNGISTGKRNAY